MPTVGGVSIKVSKATMASLSVLIIDRFFKITGSETMIYLFVRNTACDIDLDDADVRLTIY